jgi:hypothetical protein
VDGGVSAAAPQTRSSHLFSVTHSPMSPFAAVREPLGPVELDDGSAAESDPQPLAAGAKAARTRIPLMRVLSRMWLAAQGLGDGGDDRVDAHLPDRERRQDDRANGHSGAGTG